MRRLARFFTFATIASSETAKSRLLGCAGVRSLEMAAHDSADKFQKLIITGAGHYVAKRIDETQDLIERLVRRPW